MHQTKYATLPVLAALSWVTVAAMWGASAWAGRTRPWEETPQQFYMIGAIALLAAGLMTLIVVVEARSRAIRPTVASIGVGVVVLGVAASVVAWAVPLWTTVYGIGMLLVVAGGSLRRPATLMAAAFLSSTGAFILLTALQVGTPDRYGDYPVAGAAAVILGTLGPAAAMAIHARRPITQGEPASLEPTLAR